MNELRFGTAGIPLSTLKPTTITGIQRVHELGLDAMELEFVRSIHVKPGKTLEIKKVAQQHDVVLTCHAPYYINLNSKDKAILQASIGRILDSARITAMCGGYSVCMHAAYFSGDPLEKVMEKLKEIFENILKTLRDEGFKIWVRPETGGKINQFADSYDLIQMSSEMEHMLPCFDFAHQYSRTLGAWNTYEEFRKLFTEIEKRLGKEGLHNLHCHTEGIEFTDKGERNHVNLNECKLNYKDLVRVWKEFKVKGVIICESPNIEDDALLLKKTYEKV